MLRDRTARSHMVTPEAEWCLYPSQDNPLPHGPITAGVAHGHLWARPAASWLQVDFVSHRRNPSALQALLLTPIPHSIPCKEDGGQGAGAAA